MELWNRMQEGMLAMLVTPRKPAAPAGLGGDEEPQPEASATTARR
jgi:hypothetical protein